MAVMRVAEQVYGPQRDALMAADLSGVRARARPRPLAAPRSSRSAADHASAGPFAARAGARGRRRRARRHRAAGGDAGAHRGARRRAQLDRRAVRERVGADARGGARGSAARRARRGQGHVQPALARAPRRRRAQPVRHGAGRVGRLPAAARRGGGDRRRDEHARVRHGVDRPHLGLRPERQPLGPGALRRRILRWFGRGGRRPGWSPARWAPTAGGRSAIRPPTAASPASSSPGASSAVEGYTSAYSTMSTGGPMCRDAADTRLLAEVLLGPAIRGPPRQPACGSGVVRALWSDLDADVEARCREAVDALRDAGVAGDRGGARGARARARSRP